MCSRYEFPVLQRHRIDQLANFWEDGFQVASLIAQVCQRQWRRDTSGHSVMILYNAFSIMVQESIKRGIKGCELRSSLSRSLPLTMLTSKLCATQ
jgi:hypothetical protein